MTRARVRTIAGLWGVLGAFALFAAAPAGAQSISGFAVVKNAGNSPDNFQDGLTDSYQRTTTVAVLSNNGIVARARYAEVVGTDSGFLTTSSNTQASDYNVNFNVTAPGAYDLNITTSLNGAFTLVDDGSASATADVTAVAGTQTGGTLSGTLSLADPGSVTSNSGNNTPFLRTSAAVVAGTSNGSPVAHSLRFTWSASCNSVNGFTGGDECAVRLGIPINYAGETAGDYPGSGGRVQADDGHFVTVSLVSLCGDGVVQGARGEQCDLGGGLNGTPGTCCSSSCQLLPNGASCRDSAGVCDIAETCDGVDPTCPADAKSTAVCRPSAGICDVVESCNGIGNNCPADSFANLFTVCRASAGACDLQENCSGSGPNCPADAKRPNSFVCRASAGVCDIAENCDGSSNACPADDLQPNGTLCRAAAGICDIAETCDGSNPACPANAVEPNSTECRAAAGICDQAENCDGSGADCPADVFLGSGMGSFVCRASAGPCDVTDLCDGSGPDCPADAVAPGGTICRASGGVCDLTETCDGTNTACPADAKSTAVCRGSAGLCDVAESCDGANNACPGDAFAPATTECRPSAAPCDLPENCSGASATCPADTGLPDTDGDTVCDGSDNCISVANTGQENDDSDTFGNACDPCTNIAGTQPSKTKLILSKILAPTTDDKLNFKGFFLNVPGTPSVDPVTNGLRIIVTDSTGASPIDVTIPGGAYNPVTKIGWKVNGSGTAWKYKNSTSPVNGVNKAQLKAYPSTPGKYKFAVKGKNGDYAVNTANLPLQGTLVIDVPTAETGQCGETTFLLPPTKPNCSVTGAGKNVKCK